jgi:hypothetical protein
MDLLRIRAVQDAARKRGASVRLTTMAASDFPRQPALVRVIAQFGQIDDSHHRLCSISMWSSQAREVSSKIDYRLLLRGPHTGDVSRRNRIRLSDMNDTAKRLSSRDFAVDNRPRQDIDLPKNRLPQNVKLLMPFRQGQRISFSGLGIEATSSVTFCRPTPAVIATASTVVGVRIQIKTGSAAVCQAGGCTLTAAASAGESIRCGACVAAGSAIAVVRLCVDACARATGEANTALT